MANALYDHGREGFLDGSIDWDTNAICLVFIDEADDPVALDTDEDYADIVAGARVDTTWGVAAFSTKTVAAGVADADNVTVVTVSGDQFESVTILVDTTVEATSRLIANIDTATGLACTPNGGDITVQWDDGANKIFKL